MFNWISNLMATLFSALTVNLLPAALFLVAGVIVIRLVRKIVTAALEKTQLEKAAHSLVLSLLNAVLYLILGLIIASRLGIDVTSIVALASVLTLAVSLALQNILANVIGGFTILYTKPFHSGDFVEIAGQSGTVKEINMTYTMLATPDNRLVSIPNSAVIAAQIINFTALGTRRVDVAVSASYDMDVQKVIDTLVIAGTMDKVLLDPAPFAGVDTYGDSVIKYTLRVWCKAEDYWDVFFAVNQNVKKIFDDQGVRMSYPHLNVHLDK